MEHPHPPPLCHQEWTSIHTHTQPRRRSTSPKFGIWNLAFTYLESTPGIRKSAVETLIQLTQWSRPFSHNPFATLEGGLTSLVYAPRWGTFQHSGRSHHGTCGAVERCGEEFKCTGIFGDVVRKIDELRVKMEFQYREGADVVFSASARAARVDGLLRLLPLNLVPEER